MSKKTTNVDQANFNVLSANPQKKGFKVVIAKKFPSNIDPEALKEKFNREGAVDIKLINDFLKKEEKGFEPGE